MSFYIVLLVSLILHSSPQLHVNGQGDIQVDPVETVTLLNQVRSSSVSESGQRISNLNALVWDQDLADLASLDTVCTFTRGPMTQPESKVEDEKFIEIATGVTDPHVFVQQAFIKWATQGVIYDLGSQTCNSQAHNCEHFIQLVWAESCRVGCGARDCIHAHILVCRFDPVADYTPGALPYLLGAAPCANCSNPQSCVNNLCTGECGPDMMTGSDPHFSVRLPSGQLLCFTVQGEVGMSFNLISTDKLEMNARFIRLPHNPNNTWLGALGITVAGRKLIFNSTAGTVSIDNKMTFNPTAVQKITVKDHQLFLEMAKGKMKGNNKVEVDIRRLNLKFTVVFANRKSNASQHLDMLWSSGAIDTQRIHGLLGQFLRSGVMVDEGNQLLILPGRPSVPVVHQKLFAFIRAEAPEYKAKSCWTAKKRSNQGVGVIEGTYTDYEVNNLLSTGFNFGVASNDDL